MKRYLKIALQDKGSVDITLEDSNMYLAEDRIMCLGIHALGYDISYLPDVESSVDPVTSLTRLLGQRRRKRAKFEEGERGRGRKRRRG